MKQWLILFLIATTPAFAHEFWLQPESYTGVAGESINVDWRIGMDFKGTPYVYLPDMATQVGQYSAGNTILLSPRFAAKPALNITLGPDTTIAFTESSDFSLDYDDKSAFIAFLDKDRVRDQVVENEIATQGKITERYRRYAKTLIRASGAFWQDTRVGMDFEWLLDRQGDKLQATLYRADRPLPAMTVRLFEKSGSEPATMRIGTTNENGVVNFEGMAEQTSYLLNAIHLYPIDATTNEFGASWHSDWASVTFLW